MTLAVRIEPLAGSPRDVEYRWDADTDILSARMLGPAHVAPPDTSIPAGRATGSVELEGADGSWLILDLSAGIIDGVEVAVWPDVHTRRALAPPSAIQEGCVVVPAAESAGVAAFEVETALLAEADESERIIHFRLGPARHVRTVRLGRDLLLDLDPQSRIAGLWMLNVPPCPSPRAS